jgi:hypothetical protein
MWVNSGWKNAGDIQIGDKLLNSKNQSVEVQSIEWQQKKTDVYNLTIDKKSTYFAGDVYVHNDKGGGGGIRDNFTDVAYWNPYVITDANGEATVRFTIPDNLTTWITQAVAITTDTKVGESSQEILVSKPVIIRPVLPNILRIGDELSISTIAHNFTGEDRQFVNSIEMSNVQIEGSTTRDREASGAKAGDTLNVTLELDDGYRQVDVPPALYEALKTSHLEKTFHDLIYSKRKEYARQVAEAKADDTRTRRIEKIIAELREL